ncbi:MAG: aminopeptidase P family protein [Planctomycetes bacterium]|nr:aminopeptidase P family protein [Planctomycetota bacterium]
MTTHTLRMTAPPATYRDRRRRLAEKLQRPILLCAGRPSARHYATNTYPFRAGSSYLYFGGPPVCGAAILIEPGSDGEDGCTLVRDLLGFDDVVWIGATPSDTQLAEAAGLSKGDLLSPDQLPGRLRNRTAGLTAPPCPKTREWLTSLGATPAEPDELLAIIDLRLYQDEHELAAMRNAAKVGADAHRAAMRVTRPGRRESDVAAALLSIYTAVQCGPSFTPIVSIHGEVLHSESYPNALAAGRLLLVDSGAEEPGGYASDITRTYPVSGKFSTIQRRLYDTVLRAEREAIAACVPGRRFRDIHDLAGRIICEGLVEADLLRGDAAELSARGAHTLFFPHGLGHLLGLDVHDMEDFGDLAGYAKGRERRPEFGNKFLRLDRDLAPGMTVTIEPGIYIVPAIWENDELTAPFADAVNRPAIEALIKDQFGGIRIEDDVHIRAGDAGPEVLTADLPKDADAVAALVGSD